MKRLLASIIILSFVSIASAQSRYWVGTSGSAWSNTANWSTTSGGASGASSPVAANDVIFDNGFNGNVQMDVLSATTFTINSLLVTANSNVNLERNQSGGGDRILQLASTSSTTKGLKIDNGSSLIISAVNTGGGTLDYTLALTGGIGVTGEVSGNLHIKGTGSCGTEIDLYDDVTHYAALVVKNLGVIKYFDNTDNTSPSTGSYLTMESGSTYEIEKNGGSFPPGNWDPNSLAKVFNATGANAPAFNGTTYGNLEWNCPNQSNYSLTADMTFNNVNLIHTKAASGSAFRITNTASASRSLTINGNFDISSNAKFEITGSSVTTGGGTLNLKGYLNNAGIFTTTGGAGTTNDFILNGSSNQNITNTGTFSGTRLVLTMNNAAGATLLSPLTLPGNLTLTNGIIKTTSTNLLTMIDNATYSGSSMTSFINGPMKKIGDEGFVFPIGEGLEYARIEISSGGAAISTEFTAQYFRGNPRTVIGSPYETPAINHMSVKEWWTLDKNGVGTKNITLYTRTFTDATLLTDLRVLRWDGSIWVNEGLLSTSGTPGNGTVQSLLVSNFFAAGTPTPFTFGSVTSNQNPLPIDLISFNASRLSNTSSSINWELAACCSSAAKFEIQRAGTNKAFVTIAAIGGSETSKLYDHIDNDLKNGVNYYRLKMIDADGKISYSRIVAVMNGVKGLLLTSLIPTVVTDHSTLTVASSDRQKLDVMIVDMQGRVVMKRNYTIAAGNTNIELSMARLPAGVYQLTGITIEGKTNTIRFIKQ